MSSAEDHRWWDDVEHPIETRTLREEAEASAERRVARVRADGPAAPRRERTLSRAHAAGFADAFDLDGAFGAPSHARRRPGVELDDDGGHVIVLDRGGHRHDDDREHGGDWNDVQYPRSTPKRTLTLVTDDDAPTGVDEPDAYPGAEPATSARRSARSGDAAEPAPRTRRDLEARRPTKSLGEIFTLRPDRMGLYTVLLGIFLVILAAASGGHT